MGGELETERETDECRMLGVTVPRPHSAVASSRKVLRCSSAGLCNRLRAVLSHHLAATECGCTLTVVWTPSLQCPGNFADLFEPLAGVEFVTSYQIAEGDGGDDANDYHESVKGQPARMQRCWAALALLPALCHEVDANVAACAGDFVAIHMRRTDHVALYEPLIVAMQCEASDGDFERFCEAHPERHIFVATDCEETQLRLRLRYPTRCHVGRHPFGVQSGSALRQTSLRASAVDLFTCVEATIFKGSPFSSFSDAICHLRAVHGASHASDEHTPELAPSDTPQWRETILASAHAQAAQGNAMLMRMLMDSGVDVGVDVSGVRN